MKFFGITLVSIIASASVGFVASTSVRGKEALTRALLKKAVKVDPKSGPLAQQKKLMQRKVQEDDDGFEITSAYTVQFNSCVSLQTGPSNENNNDGSGLLFSDDLITYTQSGKIVNEVSYVLFNVCKTAYCSYYNDETSTTYMIDINSYMQSLAQFYLDEQQKFCAACYYNYNYCEYVKEQEAKNAQYYKTNSKYDQATMAESQYVGAGYDAEDGSAYQSSSTYKYNHNYQTGDDTYQGNGGGGGNSYQYSNGYGNNNGGYNNGYNQGYQANNYQNYNPYQNNNNNYQSGNGYYNGGGNRKLDVDMSAFKVLNCTKCDEMLCTVESDDGNQQQGQQVDDAWAPSIDMESVAQWIDAMTECPQTSATLLDQGTYPLYSGFMCNEDGTGIEIALYLDEDCVSYTSLQSFNKVASAQYDQPYLAYAKKVLEFPIENEISCDANFKYVNQDVYTAIMNGQGGYTYNNNDNGEEQQQDENDDEPSEFCRDLFDGGEEGEAVPIANCPQDNDGQNQNQVSSDGEVIMYYDYYNQWYTYVVSEENARESRNVCPIVAAMHGQYSYIYQPSGSGSLYRNTTSTSTGTSSSVVSQYAKMASEKLTPKLIAVIVAVVLAATLALCCILYSCCCMSSTPNQFTEKTESVRQRRRRSLSEDDNSRRERLVDATTGQLA